MPVSEQGLSLRSLWRISAAVFDRPGLRPLRARINFVLQAWKRRAALAPFFTPAASGALSRALDKRPEMHQAVVDLKNREITKKAARNALLPTLDLVGFYGGSGIAGASDDFGKPMAHTRSHEEDAAEPSRNRQTRASFKRHRSFRVPRVTLRVAALLALRSDPPTSWL